MILGMDTLAKWGVRVDCAQRSVHLLASNGQEVTVSATEPSGFLHQMEARPTDGIRVVSEFPDVFPEDLPEEGREVDEDISLFLLASQPRIWGRDSCKGVGSVTP